MIGWARSCLGRLFGVTFVVMAAVAAWWWNPDIVDRVIRPAASGPPPEHSPALADEAMSRFESFRNGAGGGELRLGGAELSSLIRYSFPGVIPAAIHDPEVRLRGGRVHLFARMPVAALPDLPALREVMGLLPDTVSVELRGSLVPFGDDRAAFHVDRLDASRVPIPTRYIPELLRAMGRVDLRGLPEDALAVPLPPGLRTAFVLRDSLVLVAQP